MKSILKLLICFVLITSLLAIGACSGGDKDESKDNASIESSEASNETSDETSDETSELSSVDPSVKYDEAILGTWYLIDYSLMLKEDGNGVYCVDGELIPLTWETNEGRITFTIEDKDISLPEDEEYTLSEDGKTLTIGSTEYSNAPIEVKDDLDPALIGTWYNYDSAGEEITVFKADGSGSITSEDTEMTFTWVVKNGVLTMSIDMGDTIVDMNADSYRFENGNLYMTLMGVEGEFTKTRKELGGNEELVGTWIEPNAPIVDDYVDYAYSITFNSAGSGDYTSYEGEDYTSYSLIWTEKDGNLTLTLYSLNWETFEDEEVATVTVSYTISEDGTMLTLNENGKTTSFEFYEEEYVDVPGVGVDTDHELGGDSAIVGEWEAEVEDERIALSISADGTVLMDIANEELECSWYTEDGMLMIYTEFMGEAMSLMYGDYKVDNDWLIINCDGDYTAFPRKGSGKEAFGITVYETSEDFVDTENSKIYKENGGEEILEFSFSPNLKDVKFVSFTNKGGNHTDVTTLYEVPTLGDEEYFVAYTTVNDGDSIRGVTFTAPNGKAVNLLLTYDENTEYYSFIDITDGVVQ